MSYEVFMFKKAGPFLKIGTENGTKKAHNFFFLDDRGKLRIRFRHNGKRPVISTSLDYTEANVELAKQLTKQIESVIKKGKFDETLEIYKNFTYTIYKTHNSPNKYDSNDNIQFIEKPFNSSLIADFEQWTKNYRQKDCEKHIDYHATRTMLKRWGLFKMENGLSCLNKETFGTATYNRRLKMVHDFFKWGVKHRGYKVNPFEDVSRKQKDKDKPVSTKREPFTDDEANKILEAIKNDSYVPKCSHYPHSHYYPFVYFIFRIGARNGEAIGLRVRHIDLANNTIRIEEQLARNISKTNGNARIRKATKNGKKRTVPLDPDLKNILLPLLTGKQPDDLVFLSYTGIPIDDRMFQRRVFKPVLKALKIADRDLYAGRHKVTSDLINAGMNPIIVAFMMGNNPQTALKHYTHLKDLPTTLPTNIKGAL